MQRVGIEKINLYAGRFCADVLELAKLEGKDLDYVSKQVKVKTRCNSCLRGYSYLLGECSQAPSSQKMRGISNC